MPTAEEQGNCPGCGAGLVPEYPTRSRYDDKTLICGNCGLFEALVIERGGRLFSPGFEYTGQGGNENAQG